MLKRFFKSRKTGRKAAPGPAMKVEYDAAQTTHENRRHWANADLLSPNAATNSAVRRTLRSRARYEVANNSYARGMIDSLADYMVGTGATLQVNTGNDHLNSLIESEFAKWADRVKLADKLKTMRVAQAESGECFGIMANNPRLNDGHIGEIPVTLDIRLVEADRVTAPLGIDGSRERYVDGIQFDEYDNPVSYDILRRHPGDTSRFSVGGASISTLYGEYDTFKAENVLHLFRADRPGQSRGITAIASALPLFAQLRRYTLATLVAAENAAMIAGVIQSDAPAMDEDPADVEPLDEFELDRGTWSTLPHGWKMGQFKAEQPTTMYPDFKKELLGEIARCLNMPFNVAIGNSSGYNYASGRLDHQSWWKAIRIDRNHIESTILDRIFVAWFKEAVRISNYLPQQLRQIDAELSFQWFWDGLEHVDPVKEANAQAIRLDSGMTTYAEELAKQGQDWEVVFEQRAREQQRMAELGLSFGASANATNEEPQEVEQ